MKPACSRSRPALTSYPPYRSHPRSSRGYQPHGSLPSHVRRPQWPQKGWNQIKIRPKSRTKCVGHRLHELLNMDVTWCNQITISVQSWEKWSDWVKHQLFTTSLMAFTGGQNTRGKQMFCHLSSVAKTSQRSDKQSKNVDPVKPSLENNDYNNWLKTKW